MFANIAIEKYMTSNETKTDLQPRFSVLLEAYQTDNEADVGDDSINDELEQILARILKSDKRENGLDSHDADQSVLAIARRVLPKLLMRLISHCRGPLPLDMQQLDALCGLLVSLCQCGGELGELVATTLCDSHFYRRSLSPADAEDLLVGTNTAVRAQLRVLLPHNVLRRVPQRSRIFFTVRHCCALQELVFWLMRHHFPRSLHTLLNTCSGTTFREAYARALVRHYTLLSVFYTHDKSQSRAWDISSILLGDEELLMRLCKSEAFLDRLLVTFRQLLEFSGALEQSKLASDCTLRVVNSTHMLLRSQTFQQVANDLVMVLRCREVAQYLVQRVELFSQLVDNVALWQATFVFERGMQGDLDLPVDIATTVFDSVRQTCCTPLISIVSALTETQGQTLEYVQNALTVVSEALQDWLTCVGLTDQSKMTFHIPLHRYFAALLCVFLRCVDSQGRFRTDSGADCGEGANRTLEAILNPMQCFQMLQHVLDVFSGQFQVGANVWNEQDVATNLSVRYLRTTPTCIDLDLFLAQFCSSQIEADLLLKVMVDKFFLRHTLAFFGSTRPLTNALLSAKQKKVMLESFFLLLVWLVSEPTCCLTPDNCNELDRATRRHLVASLSVTDLDSASVLQLLPIELTASRELKATHLLHLIAQSTSLEAEADFTLTSHVWSSEYDPALTYLRYGRDHYRVSLLRYTANVQDAEFESVWPPLRVPSFADFERLVTLRNSRLLQSSSFYSLVFIVLAEFLHAPKSVSNSTVHFAVHLLCVAVTYQEYSRRQTSSLSTLRNTQCRGEPTFVAEVEDGRIEAWYPKKILQDPVLCVLHHIGAVRTAVGSFYAIRKVNSSILQLLIELHRVYTRTNYVPPSASSAEDLPVDNLFERGTNVRYLLDTLCQRSKIVASRFR